MSARHHDEALAALRAADVDLDAWDRLVGQARELGLHLSARSECPIIELSQRPSGGAQDFLRCDDDGSIWYCGEGITYEMEGEPSLVQILAANAQPDEPEVNDSKEE